MVEFEPNRKDFALLARTANTVPVFCSLLSDQLTPVSAFERIARDAPHAFLLESVIGGEKIARYSFLGADPMAIVEARDGETVVSGANGRMAFPDVDPLQKLEEQLAKYHAAHPRGLPRFLGGAVGYAGYDIARRFESKLSTPPSDDRGLPDLLFGLYDRMVVFDHVRKLIHVVAHAHLDSASSPEAAYNEACSRIEADVERLSGDAPIVSRPFVSGVAPAVPVDETMSRQEFEEAVDRCRQYIRAGDIFQVVLSRRMTQQTTSPPFDIYRALRVINPSPFMFYIQSPSVTLVGASPEILCRIDGRTVSTRPLAGTRARGKTEAEDLGLETELLADPKERAEHVMLVDLGRNDLARVCEPGSVVVDDLMSVERYSHVMHICSNVSGTLAKGKTAFDAIRSVLPVGTVSGAPKIRAMQIIDELEPVRRGPYGGAAGYIDFAGNMDTCIALRTLVITPSGTNDPQGQPADRQSRLANGQGRLADWRVDAQVGAGIVADSQPANEFEETCNKAQSMLSALELANAWRQD